MLNDDSLWELDFSGETTPADRFNAFNERNPQVFSALESMTKEMYTRGRKRIGINMLLEVLRWNYYMKTDDPTSDFKINNNYAPYYARLLIEKHPEYAELFQLREMRTR